METIKKKVALLTICSNNLGAILQGFALKEYIRINYDNLSVDIIKMKPNVDYQARVFTSTPGNFLRDLVIKAITLFKFKGIKRGIERRENFKKNNFSYIPRGSAKEFLEDVPKYDVYLTGSDQVFNITNPHRDLFFQRFSKNGTKKIAYAPSFGSGNFEDKMVNEITPDILDFDNLSCREQSGAELLSKITGMEVPKVLDPTLLLNAEEWDKIAIKPNRKNKYIFIYDLNGGEALIEIAAKIKVVTGFEIICLTSKPQKFYRGIDKQIYDAGPAEFLGWISEAQYVVTDSFHGTIFSLNFNKPFSTYIAMKKTSPRIISFMSEIGLLERIVEKNDSFDSKLLTLDFNRSKLESLRETSEKYLNACLGNE